MCLDNCPCHNWINCHYYNSFKYNPHNEYIKKQITLWYDVYFKINNTMPDVICNG